MSDHALAPRFQTYDDPAPPDATHARVAAIRAEMARQNLAGMIIPRGDAHMGEYVAPHDERLAWATGFTGSAGMAVVMADKAAVFIDGRYTLQVRDQVDLSIFAPHHLIDEPPAQWLSTHVKKGDRIGYDPWLHTPGGIEPIQKAVAAAGGTLVAVTTSPVDAAWADQPEPPLAPVVPHPLEIAGESAADKRSRIAATLGEAEAAVLTLPESIAWLLNIRGADVGHVPLPHSFALLHKSGDVDLFLDPRKATEGLAAHLGNGVRVRPPAEFGPALDELKDRTVLADPASAAVWVFDRLAAAGARIQRGADPILLPKAQKNAAELKGVRAAHVRDGAALTRFLRWVTENGPRGDVGEIEACERLEDFRRDTGALKDLSFDSISGSGPNGAIVHYRVTRKTDRKLRAGELFLIDSGGQYMDATTDVTRTVALGTPRAEEKDRFTRVLKGHIALATARFPAGTTGAQLDTLARAPLWAAGLDYDHGTGHGVGAYLSVHEGPQSISKRPITQALLPGMICSNEPGYYKTGGYGIRIENLIVVREADVPGAERKMLEFETVTLAPIDVDLVEPSLLTQDEKAWLNAYHARVLETLTPLVDPDTATWLKKATRAL
ncbi:MAG: aminopeptidase P family protein [Alphaproteobacteria bacterium]|nr:aminopeptidase P family protein [Alphaproteobacteria bacterium]